MTKGYDKQNYASKTDLELKSAHKASLELLVKIENTKVSLEQFTKEISTKIVSIQGILMDLPGSLFSHLKMIPFMNKKEKDLMQNINFILDGIKEKNVENVTNHIERNDTLFEIDSDEEARLFDEIDVMMDIQERTEAFRGNSQKFLANSVQCTFRRIFELENAFRLVRNIFISTQDISSKDTNLT